MASLNVFSWIYVPNIAAECSPIKYIQFMNIIIHERFIISSLPKGVWFRYVVGPLRCRPLRLVQANLNVIAQVVCPWFMFAGYLAWISSSTCTPPIWRGSRWSHLASFKGILSSSFLSPDNGLNPWIKLALVPRRAST